MANQIRIKTSVEIVKDNSVVDSGSSAGDYTVESIDAHANDRKWGGKYTVAQAYANNKVCSWNGVVVSATSADGLNNSDWTEATTLRGNIPDNVYVIAVEYVETLGTVASVSVTIGSEVHAILTKGESVVIPLAAGEAVANVKVHASAYSDGVHEATVNGSYFR